MDKRIGNFYLFIFFLSFFLNIKTNDINLRLKAIDQNGDNISETDLGIPFYLKLTIESSEDLNVEPVIEDLNGNAKFLGASNTITNINGKVSVLKDYQYEMIINKEGVYNFGPAKIEVNSQKLKSNNVKINAGFKTNKEKKINKIFLNLSINKNDLYLNEQAELTIKFYTSVDQVKLLQIEKQTINDIFFEDFKLVNEDYEQIENNEYYYSEYKVKIFPKKTGEIIIPAFKAIYEQAKNNMNFFSGFFNFNERKQVFSNSLKLNVKALPKNTDSIRTVGKFDKLNAHVNLNTAIQGEGIVYKLELSGQGNFQDIHFANLNLSKEFKFYESKNYLDNIDQHQQKKTFEFILQGIESGNFTIPSQKFTYFNIDSKTYKTLESQPITIQIKPLENKPIDLKNEIIDENNIELQSKDELLPIYNKFHKIRNNNFISWIWILLILFTTIILSYIFIFKEFVFQKFKKKPIYQLHNDLQKNIDEKKLYSIFIKYFSNQFSLKESLIPQDFLNNKFKDLNMPDETIFRWNIFFNKIAELSYGKNSYENIKEEAFIWYIYFKNLTNKRI